MAEAEGNLRATRTMDKIAGTFPQVFDLINQLTKLLAESSDDPKVLELASVSLPPTLFDDLRISTLQMKANAVIRRVFDIQPDGERIIENKTTTFTSFFMSTLEAIKKWGAHECNTADNFDRKTSAEKMAFALQKAIDQIKAYKASSASRPASPAPAA